MEKQQSDLVQVVRCGDCKHTKELISRGYHIGWVCQLLSLSVTPDKYCCYGEKEEKKVDTKNYPEPPIEPEEDENFPRCPWCGEECDTIYVDRFGRVVGCGGCIETKDAWANRHLTV